MGVLVPADVEQFVYDLLTARGFTVGATPRGDVDGSMLLPFVSYEVTGGSRRNMVTDAVVVMVRCYAVSRETCSLMCREVYGVLMGEQYAGGVVRKSTSVGHPVYYPDKDSKIHRYQASVQLQFRPEVL